MKGKWRWFIQSPLRLIFNNFIPFFVINTFYLTRRLQWYPSLVQHLQQKPQGTLESQDNGWSHLNISLFESLLLLCARLVFIRTMKDFMRHRAGYKGCWRMDSDCLWNTKLALFLLLKKQWPDKRATFFVFRIEFVLNNKAGVFCQDNMMTWHLKLQVIVGTTMKRNT